jgi:hypothetical protein
VEAQRHARSRRPPPRRRQLRKHSQLPVVTISCREIWGQQIFEARMHALSSSLRSSYASQAPSTTLTIAPPRSPPGLETAPSPLSPPPLLLPLDTFDAAPSISFPARSTYQSATVVVLPRATTPGIWDVWFRISESARDSRSASGLPLRWERQGARTACARARWQSESALTVAELRRWHAALAEGCQARLGIARAHLAIATALCSCRQTAADAARPAPPRQSFAALLSIPSVPGAPSPWNVQFVTQSRVSVPSWPRHATFGTSPSPESVSTGSETDLSTNAALRVPAARSKDTQSRSSHRWWP